MITTDNESVAESCYSFKHFGAKGNSFEIIGTNYKMSNILSAIGLVQMQKIESIIKMRSEKAKIFRELLSTYHEGITPAYVGEGNKTNISVIYLLCREGWT